ncbi:MAG: DNA repair protein RecN [Verrucomicrobia bacterium]|nr:DNA repair protein RecN [Verrucomicrobiota bacterium]
MTPLRLSTVRIRNLALVEDLSWSPGPGFTAVTGETGSGKSIIVGALKLLIGERGDRSLIRAGEEACTVEGTFEVQDAGSLNAQLTDLGVEPCDGGLLLLKRVLTAAGTNRQFINGTATTLNVLKTLGNGLVDLHGPHDHQSLLSPELQRTLLDAFAHSAAAVASYDQTYRKRNALERDLAGLLGDDAAFERECELLLHQATEIELAELKPGEEEELLGKYLREMERLDPSARRLAEAQVRAVTEVEELAAELQRYSDSLETDPEQLHQFEERINTIETLKRKYGGTLESVIQRGEDASERYHKLRARGEERQRLQRELQEINAQLDEAGLALRKIRTDAAPLLANRIMQHLRDLGFNRSEFAVHLEALPQPGPSGLDAIEFMFAPNPGEPSKALRSIASSGEISRVMLAIKSALAQEDTIPLLVFDEIDANVGGEIAHAVGQKMQALGLGRQVLCISHLPQVASKASQHFVVTKSFIGGRTISALEQAEGAQRELEIARMLGDTSTSALELARSLLSRPKPQETGAQANVL